MFKFIRKAMTDNSGASAAEYALMIALIGGVIVVTAGTLGTNMSAVFGSLGTKMGSANTAQNGK